MIRAKFHVSFIKDFMNGDEKDSESVEMHAVYSGSNENKSFAKATPSAQLSMNISNPSAFGFFKAGREYYLDFSEADS